MRIFAIAFVAEFFCNFVIVANTRAFTLGNYGWTAFTEVLFITQTFWVAKWMVEAKDARGKAAYLGFLFGGTLGSLAAIFTTKHLYGRVG